MHITKIRIQNFKKFQDRIFEFNNDLNIFVGDNESGKSTILEAIEMGLNSSYRGRHLSSSLTTDLFNFDAIQIYLQSDKSEQNLPEIVIELFLEGLPDYRGNNNSLGEDSDGISLKIAFDEDLSPTYQDFIKEADGVKTIPTEFYKIEWFDFAWNQIKYMNRKSKSLFVDPTNLHPTFGKNKYISKIFNSRLSKEQLAVLTLNYRQLKQLFNEQPQVAEINKGLDSDNIITDKSLKIVANVTSPSSIETGMQLAVDEINFPLVGKGEQNKIQIKLAIQNEADNLDVIMIEELENHLTHINLAKLVKYVDEQRDGKQLFITTHSSYVLNKLSIDRLCLISEGYIRLRNLDNKVVKRLKRLPGYDTLRVALSEKVVLVEGPSDELILKKIYLNEHGKLPEESGIDIIVVRGIGFGNYLEIAKHLGTKVNVVKDNDGKHKENILEYQKDYAKFDSISFFSPTDNALYSLEPAMIASNAKDEKSLNHYAKITLSNQICKKFQEERSLPDKISFLHEWYIGANAGSKKVDSAMRIFETDKDIEYPDFLKRALNFD